ncbi:MAG TPA: hypothetical protein VN541_01665, partial [Tepidisphaeraceae bacterium]|nr:hypothetical protein [Tepidisphaeraceae bacterium]
MGNVREKLRKGEPSTEKDRRIHEQGLVSVLKQIHDDLDAAVAEAYGWPADLSDEEILRRLVALNAERAEEEKRGLVRWLRPEFQNPTGVAATQQTLALAPAGKPTKTKAPKKTAWPKTLADQARAVRTALQSRGQPATAAELARAFQGAKADKIGELLETLATLGQARVAGEGK